MVLNKYYVQFNNTNKFFFIKIFRIHYFEM